jgi:hypothetical protein
MKPNLILSRIYLLIFLLPLLLLVTCKEKDDTNLNSDYRITETNYYHDDIKDYTVYYDYEDNRITAIRGLDGDEGSRIDIDYWENDSAVLIYSNYIDSETVVSSKKLLKLDGSQVIEDIIYSWDESLWDPTWKRNYSYENDYLSEIIEYHDDSGDWNPYWKIFYEYDGSRHLQTTSYDYKNGWQTWEILKFTYIGNNVDEVIDYIYNDGSLVDTYKIGFSYENDLMTAQTFYEDDHGSWIDEGSILYTYDSFKNLESYSFPIDGYIYKVEYKYEKGSGNYMQLQGLHEYDYFIGILPHPTKVGPAMKGLDGVPLLRRLHN